MRVSGGKVGLVGQFEIFAQDNFFRASPSSRTIFFEQVRLVGQFFWKSVLLDGLKRRTFSRN